jgi:hypothetical protein
MVAREKHIIFNRVPESIGDYPAMKKPVLAVLAVLAAWTLGSSVEPDPLTALWARTYPPYGRYFEGRDLAVDKDGNLYVSGLPGDGKTDFKYSRDTSLMNLVKFDGKGGKVWSYGISGNALALDKTGHVIVFGHTDDSTVSQAARNTTDFCLVKYSPDGKTLWTRVFGTDSLDISKDVATDDAGNIYALGMTKGSFPAQGNRGEADICAFKFNPEGKMLWSKSWGSKGYDRAWEISRAEGGTYLVSGDFAGPLEGSPETKLAGPFSMIIRENGEEVSRHPIKSGRGPILRQFRGEDGGLGVIGYTEKDSIGSFNLRSDIYITKLDKNRKELWTRHWNMPGDKRPGASFGDKQGNLFVTGVTDFPKESISKIFIIKYDGKGDLIYQHFRNTTIRDRVAGLALDAEGEILILGSTSGELGKLKEPTKPEAFILKITPHPPPSFDCLKAASVQEQLICKHARLSAFDDSIAALYSEYIAQSRTPERRAAEHAKWVMEIRNTKTTEADLDSAMSARVFELRGKTEENLIRK